MFSGCLQWRIQRGGGAEGTFAPPPLKSAKEKKKKCFNPHIWWLKMQNFLGPLRSLALFNIILNIAFLKNLENNTCSYMYILSSFYMVATGEGTFDMKMQDFWTLKSLNCRSFRGASPPPPPWSPTGLRPGPDWGPRRSPGPSPNFAPSNPKTWIRAWFIHNETDKIQSIIDRPM